MKSKSTPQLAWLIAFSAMSIGAIANAQDEKKKQRQGQRRGLAQQVMARFRNVDFSDEQKAKVKEITKKYSAKVAEIRKESNGLMTAEQRKARSEALRNARKEGMKYNEALAAADKKAGLSEELIAKLKESQKKMQALQKEIGAEVNGILTDEQKAKIRKSRKGNAAPKGKKKKDDKAPGQVVNLRLPNMT